LAINFKEIPARKSLEEKREESVEKIMDASMKLFYLKGYSATTTRDIIKEAGILNGSLYNRFKNKEEILQSIVNRAIKTVLDESERVLEKEKNPILAFALPASLEIYLSCNDKRAAELIYEANRSWSMVESFVESEREWSSKYLSKYGVDFGSDPWLDLKVSAIIGAVGNICGHYAKGGTEDYREVLAHMVKFISTLLEIPVFEVNHTVDRLVDILKSNEIVFCKIKMKFEEGSV